MPEARRSLKGGVGGKAVDLSASPSSSQKGLCAAALQHPAVGHKAIQ